MHQRLPKVVWIVICLVLVPVLGVLDRNTGLELNFLLFYFIPVGLGAWYVGVRRRSS